MPKFVYPLIIIVCSVFLFNFCNSDSRQRHEYTSRQRQDMIPAKTANEWISRLKLDLTESLGRGTPISQLYTELPAPDQWSAISAKLDEITKDEASFEKFSKSQNSIYLKDQIEFHRLEIQLFSTLMAENGNDVEPLYRSLLLKQKDSHYIYSEGSLKKLLLLSKNPPASIAWYQENIAKADNHSSHHSSKTSKPAWKKALAENRIDEGIKLLIKAIKAARLGESESLISHLANIAYLLDRPELGEQALKMLEKDIISRKKSEHHFSTYSYQDGLDYYARTEQWQRLFDLCEKVKNTEPDHDPDSFYRSSSSSDDFLLSYQLTSLYKLNKFDAFEKSLNAEIKKWKSQPEKFFYLLEKKIADCPSIGACHIDLLSAKGDLASKELAYKICTHLLARNQGKDAYYKRAIALKPEAAASFIASLRKFDPYEERPLIWLAEMALQAGEIKKADKLILQAIALDPSDGDHGKFSRMLCYDVYSRVLEKQGDTEKAKFFKEVMLSIRQGEVADDFLSAGLTQEATDRYKKALGHFNDAYCLQSRLAKTLMEAGKFEEAIPHFKKAFELMPVSFGPRESQCFGCEGLFDDKRVQDIALPTLNAFLAKEPANPRTPYLLGLLFEEMKKEKEAITAYRKAIELDPQYYNAARNLYRLITKDPKNFSQVQELQKHLFEISAYSQKPIYIPNPHLLKSYWKLAQDFPPSPIVLAPLGELGLATKKLSNEQFKELKPNEAFTSSMYSYFDTEAAIDGWSAREILLRNSFLRSYY